MGDDDKGLGEGPGVLGDSVADWKGGEALVWSAGGIGAGWGSWGSLRPEVLKGRLRRLGEALPWDAGEEWGKTGWRQWPGVLGSTEQGRNGTARVGVAAWNRHEPV